MTAPSHTRRLHAAAARAWVGSRSAPPASRNAKANSACRGARLEVLGSGCGGFLPGKCNGAAGCLTLHMQTDCALYRYECMHLGCQGTARGICSRAAHFPPGLPGLYNGQVLCGPHQWSLQVVSLSSAGQAHLCIMAGSLRMVDERDCQLPQHIQHPAF